MPPPVARERQPIYIREMMERLGIEPPSPIRTPRQKVLVAKSENSARRSV
jgi:hypothetical protein